MTEDIAIAAFQNLIRLDLTKLGRWEMDSPVECSPAMRIVCISWVSLSCPFSGCGSLLLRRRWKIVRYLLSFVAGSSSTALSFSAHFCTPVSDHHTSSNRKEKREKKNQPHAQTPGFST